VLHFLPLCLRRVSTSPLVFTFFSAGCTIRVLRGPRTSRRRWRCRVRKWVVIISCITSRSRVCIGRCTRARLVRRPILLLLQWLILLLLVGGGMLLPILLWLILLPILLWLILLLVMTWRLRVGGGMRLVNLLMLGLRRCWVCIELAQCWVPAGGVRRHWRRRIWSREQAGPDRLSCGVNHQCA
jgi:hypothetical protein